MKAPKHPYYIYDVEDGQALLGKSPLDAEKIIKSEKRYPLNVAKVIALTTHTDVFSRHNVDAAGFRYEKSFRRLTFIFTTISRSSATALLKLTIPGGGPLLAVVDRFF